MGHETEEEQSKPMLTLVQITDSHLFASEEETLSGMNCQQSFAAVLEHIRHHHPALDGVLCTGDLVQDASVDGYQRFFRQVADLQAPQLWLAGNHDDRVNMKLAVGEGSPCLQQSLWLGNWRIIMLETQVEGKVYGMLSEAELERLQALLQASEAQHVLLCIHHNPVPVNAAWLQQHSLKNAQALFDVLDGYSHVRAVLFGHVHQEVNEQRNGVSMLASPSTCVQFHPDNDFFSLDKLNPGYRWLQLFADGRVETGVERVAGNFQIDFSSTGY